MKDEYYLKDVTHWTPITYPESPGKGIDLETGLEEIRTVIDLYTELDKVRETFKDKPQQNKKDENNEYKRSNKLVKTKQPPNRK